MRRQFPKQQLSGTALGRRTCRVGSGSIYQALEKLSSLQLVTSRYVTGRGRPTTVWFAIDPACVEPTEEEAAEPEEPPGGKPRAHRAHFLAISRPPNPDFLPGSAGQARACAFPQRKAHEVCRSYQVPATQHGTAPLAAGLRQPTVMVSTIDIAIQPGSEKTTGIPSRSRAASSLLRLAGADCVSAARADCPFHYLWRVESAPPNLRR